MTTKTESKKTKKIKPVAEEVSLAQAVETAVIAEPAVPSAEPVSEPVTQAMSEAAPAPVVEPAPAAAASEPVAEPAAPVEVVHVTLAETGGVVEPAKAKKARKPKLVRDSFTLPEADYALFAELKTRCLAQGVAVKKSELLRLGLVLLAELAPQALAERAQSLEKIKTGRPAKG